MTTEERCCLVSHAAVYVCNSANDHGNGNNDNHSHDNDDDVDGDDHDRDDEFDDARNNCSENTHKQGYTFGILASMAQVLSRQIWGES